MRNSFAQPEVEALRGKIKDGSATDEEKARYQRLLGQHAQLNPESYEARVARAREYAGYSINQSPEGFVPIAPNGPLPEIDYGKQKKRSKKPIDKPLAMPYVRPIATIMSTAKGPQDRVVFYDMYPAAPMQNAASPSRLTEQAKSSCHPEIIDLTKDTKTPAATKKVPSPARGQKRVYAPVPLRTRPEHTAKRHKIEKAAGAAPARGILRHAKPASQPPGTRKQPSLIAKIDPTAFLRAMRASAATRGQQEHILTVLRATSSSSSDGSRRSAFDSHQKKATRDLETQTALAAKAPSRPIKKSFAPLIKKGAMTQRVTNTPSPPAKRSRSSPTSPQATITSPPVLRKELAPPAQKPASPPVGKVQATPIEKPRSPRSVEEETKMRRLAGMQSTTAMLTQTIPPDLMKKAIKSNPNMSTTHLLRRLGNPHRRVVHQMLRDQNAKIIREMKKKQLAKTKTTDAPETQAPKPAAQMTSVAVGSK